MSTTPRILIIGQGLAGTAVAWRLWERGVPFLSVDRDEAVTCSKTAAGLITPVTGMRLKTSWRFEVFYPEALRFYRRVSKQLGLRFFHPRGQVRLFKDDNERTKWPKRLAEAEVADFVATQSPALNAEVFSQPHKGFQMRHAAWMNTAAYLSASRDFFAKHGQHQKADVRPEEVVSDENGVTWRGEGWEAAKHPLFGWVPFQSALGTILTAQADLRGERRIINRGCWVLPMKDGTLRAGSTYEWQFEGPHTPSEAAVAGLEAKLRALVQTPLEILHAQSAVRPIIKGKQALCGTHPAHPRVAFLNGLGSKGTLRAPWLAQHLVAHLLDGTALDTELDLQDDAI
jgi:glycine/D-amino acid oxidase-like deaminating enzyme